jgi:hypothetical protein
MEQHRRLQGDSYIFPKVLCPKHVLDILNGACIVANVHRSFKIPCRSPWLMLSLLGANGTHRFLSGRADLNPIGPRPLSRPHHSLALALKISSVPFDLKACLIWMTFHLPSWANKKSNTEAIYRLRGDVMTMRVAALSLTHQKHHPYGSSASTE